MKNIVKEMKLGSWAAFEHCPIEEGKLSRTAYGVLDGPAYKVAEVRANKTATLFSHTEENGSMGLSMNGVKSWGDIAAGYDGFLFWRDFYGKDKSMIRCENGKFVQIYKFDWSNWVSKAWDESINCNEYSDKLGKSVTKRINELEIKWNRKINCPLEPNTCGDLTLRYIEVFPLVLHPKCRDLSKVTRLNENLKKLVPPKMNCP